MKKNRDDMNPGSKVKIRSTGTRQHDSLVPSTQTRRFPQYPTAVILSRIARSPPKGDKLSEFVTHMRTFSRIVNGIALQAGLMESSIPADDVIAELLHMGSMKPDQLIAINPADVKAVMEVMTNAKSNLVSDAGVTNVEDRFLKMTAVVKANINSDDFKKFVGKSEYETELANLGASKVTEADVDKPVSIVAKVKSDLEYVKDMKSDTDANIIKQDFGELIVFPGKLENVESSAKDYGKVLTLVQDLKRLVEKSSFIQLLIDEENAHKNYGVFSGDVGEEGASDNWKHFEGMTDFFNRHIIILRNFDSLAESLMSGSQNGVQYSAGLSDGAKDLDNLAADVDDQWFKTSANVSGETSLDLRKGLFPLDGFKTNLKQVETIWKPVMPKVGSVKTVVSQQIDIARQKKDAAARAKAITEFGKCHNDHRKKTVKTEIVTALGQINNFNNEVKQLSNFDAVSHLTNLTVLKDAMKFDSTFTQQQKEDVTPKIVAKLKQMPEVATTISHLKQFLIDANNLKKIVENLATNVTNIQSGLKTINTYHGEVLKSNFLEWSDCLKKNAGSDAESVAKMVVAVRRLQDPGLAQEIVDAEAFMNTILKSTTVIQAARSSAKSMQSVSEAETKKLKLLVKAKDVSLELGMAVRGITEIKKADDNRQKLDPLTGDVSYIQTAANQVSSQLEQDHLQGLADIVSLQKELNQTFSDIDAFKPSVDNLVGTDLNSHKAVFVAAAKIRGVKKADVARMKKAVAALSQKSPTIQQQLANVDTSLDTLDQLDLDFANFQMGRAPTAIDGLTAFFTNFANSKGNSVNGGTTGVPGAAWPSGPGGIPGAVTMAGLLPATQGLAIHWIVIAVVGSLLVICVIGGLVYYVFVYEKDDGEDAALEAALRNKEVALERSQKRLREQAEEIFRKRCESDATMVEKEKKLNEKEAEFDDKKKKIEESLKKKEAQSDERKKKDEAEVEKILRMLEGQKRAKDEKERNELIAAIPNMLNGLEEFWKAIERYMEEDKNTARTFCYEQVKLFTEMNKKLAKNEEDRNHERERRYVDIYRSPANAVQLEPKKAGDPKPYIHANFLTLRNGKKWLLSQGPLDGTENGKVSTIETHWMMIDQYNVTVIAQLCNFVENGRPKCGRYYPEVGKEITFGEYTVRTTGQLDVNDRFTVEKEHISVLTVEYTFKGKTKSVDVLRYLNWPDHSAPRSARIPLEIINFCDSYDKTVLVHCSAGIGRTGTLAGIKKGIEICEQGHSNTVDSIMIAVRECRYKGVQNTIQMMYMLTSIAKAIVEKHRRKEFIACYPALQFYYERILDNEYPAIGEEAVAGAKRLKVKKVENKEAKETKETKDKKPESLMNEEDAKEEIKNRKEYVEEVEKLWKAKHVGGKKNKHMKAKKKKFVVTKPATTEAKPNADEGMQTCEEGLQTAEVGEASRK